MNSNCYAVLPAYVRYDKHLSAGAKLLYAELSAGSMSDGTVSEDIKFLTDVLGCDRRTLYRYFSQLAKRGYINRVEKGKWQLPQGFAPLSSEPVGEEESDEMKEFFKDFFKAFEKGVNCYVERQELYHGTLKERLERFSRNELMRALENRVAFISGSEWHQMPENRPNATDITLLIRDDQSVLKWLNMKTEKTDVILTPIKFQ